MPLYFEITPRPPMKLTRSFGFAGTTFSRRENTVGRECMERESSVTGIRAVGIRLRLRSVLAAAKPSYKLSSAR